MNNSDQDMDHYNLYCFYKGTSQVIYVISYDSGLDLDQILKLQWIFQANYFNQLPTQIHDLYYEISTKANMISPWCSNVLTILERLGGLDNIVRVEQSYLIPKAKADGRVPKFDEMTEQLCNVTPLTLEELTSSYHNPEKTYVLYNSLSRDLPKSIGNRYEIREFYTDNVDLRDKLINANRYWNLGMDQQDISSYLLALGNKEYITDVELFDLAQCNSEHSRHWVFNGVFTWLETKKILPRSLFDMLKKPLKMNPKNSVVAMKDNSSAILGSELADYYVCFEDKAYNGDVGKNGTIKVNNHVHLCPILTAETHNFPTGIAPFPGAATGVGGRIRDIQGMGRGGRMIAGIAGYSVGRINCDSLVKKGFAYPLHRPEKILVDASNGASDYGNKIGEPMIGGFTRSFGKILKRRNGLEIRSEYIKPIMFSAGVGQVQKEHLFKGKGDIGYLIVRLGGPALRIGVGGGAASSRSQSNQNINYDLSAVQRGNPEMENRMQKVLRTCYEMGNNNPIISIHDQGAGGMGNVTKEIILDACPSKDKFGVKRKLGAFVSLANVVSGDESLSSRELWTAEYQEQNTILIHPKDINLIKDICQREGCPVAFVGVLNDTGNCEVFEPNITDFDDMPAWRPVNLNLEDVSSKMAPKRFTVSSTELEDILTDGTGTGLVKAAKDLKICQQEGGLDEMLEMVLSNLNVGSKRFLTNKVDRSVGGLVAQQQCVGPFHTPLSDYSLVAQSMLDGCLGIASSVGEQPIKGQMDLSSMIEMTVGEMLTNLVWVAMSDLEDIKCSGNWMWEKSHSGELYALYRSVEAVSDLLCELGIAIDGGKDSLSMSADCGDGKGKIFSPRTLVMTAYVGVPDINLRVTPEFKGTGNHIIYVDLGYGQYRMGGSIMIQEYCEKGLGREAPDIVHIGAFKEVLKTVQKLIRQKLIVSGHDRSDGGLISCLSEMAMASQFGFRVDLTGLNNGNLMSLLFSEELGLVMEVKEENVQKVMNILTAVGSFNLGDIDSDSDSEQGETGGVIINLPVYDIGKVSKEGSIEIFYDDESHFQREIHILRTWWETQSHYLERMQCDLTCVRKEHQFLTSEMLNQQVPRHFLTEKCQNTYSDNLKIDIVRETLMILRDMGSNGDREMAHAFYVAGFQPVDVTMNDLIAGKFDLADFRGLVFVGGFTFADSLGAGRGWALSIQEDSRLKKMFEDFKNRPDTFSLGICNGCQLMAELGWVGTGVKFLKNKSGRFESRFSSVKINKEWADQTVMLRDMGDCVLGIWVAHGEGRYFTEGIQSDNGEVLHYVDHDGQVVGEEDYPLNPNGGLGSVAGICSEDGRHLAMMPHPERCVMKYQVPWISDELAEIGIKEDRYYPWVQMFINARKWIDIQ